MDMGIRSTKVRDKQHDIDNLSNLSFETCMSIFVLLRTVDVELCVRLDDLLVDNNTGSSSTASSTTESTAERASTSTA